MQGAEEPKAQNMWKIFPLVCSKKPLIRENWDELSVYFSMIKSTIIPTMAIWDTAIWQNWVLANFIIQRLKNKHFISVFLLSGQRFFLREREEIFSTYFGPKN